MIVIGNTIVSDDLIESFFICHLDKCKGACCIEGDLGAPLEKEELKIVDEIIDQVKPFLSKQGLREIKKQGNYIIDFEGDYSTPTIRGRECAYSVYDHQGVLKCGFELAFEKGNTGFRKPISCHLYPVRISKNNLNTSVNYHQWEICSPACTLGAFLNMPLYKFLKDPLIRKFGEEWYTQLEKAISARHKK